MSMSHSAGDPAFPTMPASDAKYGISVRDYFAAQALTGLLAIPRPPGAQDAHAQIAQAAYKYAAAMLEAR
jgi:hypothetical protein